MYWIGSPIVDKAELSLKDGKTLTIIVENQSESNCYVESVSLNGVPIKDTEISHSLISGGGTLVFKMTGEPCDLTK